MSRVATTYLWGALQSVSTLNWSLYPVCITHIKQRVRSASVDEGIPLDTSIFYFLYHLQALIWGHLDVRGCISFNDTHVMNTAHLIFKEVTNKKVFSIFRFLWNQWWIVGCVKTPSLLTWRPGPHALHVTTILDEGVIAHMIRREGLAGQVENPIT